MAFWVKWCLWSILIHGMRQRGIQITSSVEYFSWTVWFVVECHKSPWAVVEVNIYVCIYMLYIIYVCMYSQQQLSIWRSSRPSGACLLGWQEVFCWVAYFGYKVYSCGGLTWTMWMFWFGFGFWVGAGESICRREDVWHSDRSVDGTCLRRESCGFHTRGQPLHTFHPRPCVHTRHLLVRINFILLTIM